MWNFSNGSNAYHKQLRYFVNKRILMGDIDIDDYTWDIHGFDPDRDDEVEIEELTYDELKSGDDDNS